MKKGEYGEYVSPLRNGNQIDGNIRLLSNTIQLMELVALCMLLYNAMMLGKREKAFHDLHVV